MRYRSLLFVPGMRPDRFGSAMAAGADVVIFDLEDSVVAGRKAEAREAVAAFLAAPPASASQVFVRLNATGSAWFADDLAFAAGLAAIQGVVLPKAESPDQVEQVARSVGSRVVLPLLETARGILNAQSIATAQASIAAVLFGAEDLTAEIGIARTVDGDELLYARSHIVLAATAAGAEAVDAVFVDVADADTLRQDALRARALGFRGKMAIHPDQIPVIHEVFTPTPAEIAQARRTIAAYDAALAQGQGVARLDNQMIDAPLVARARRVLDAEK